MHRSFECCPGDLALCPLRWRRVLVVICMHILITSAPALENTRIPLRQGQENEAITEAELRRELSTALIFEIREDWLVLHPEGIGVPFKTSDKADDIAGNLLLAKLELLQDRLSTPNDRVDVVFIPRVKEFNAATAWSILLFKEKSIGHFILHPVSSRVVLLRPFDTEGTPVLNPSALPDQHRAAIRFLDDTGAPRDKLSPSNDQARGQTQSGEPDSEVDRTSRECWAEIGQRVRWQRKKLRRDQKEPLYFESAAGKIYFIDLPDILEGYSAAGGKLGVQPAEREQPAPGVPQTKGRCVNYRIRVLTSGRIELERRETAIGTILAGLRDPQSEFGAVISRANPETQRLFFMIRPDSWRSFQEASDVARSRGFMVDHLFLFGGEPVVFTPSVSDRPSKEGTGGLGAQGRKGGSR